MTNLRLRFVLVGDAQPALQAEIHQPIDIVIGAPWPDRRNVNDAAIVLIKLRSDIERLLGPALWECRSAATPPMDLQRLGCHDEISSIRADALSQFSERGFDVSCNLVPLGIDEPGRDPGDQMLKGRAALQSDCARPQLQPEK